ncbi:DsbA family protein [Nonomuraea sp. NPDC001831]|uniref:DsbA family protein n=1 Tax=Nonomuraea sp. NPDC001831 TaxID=3364340 RepID=UPI0036C2748F
MAKTPDQSQIRRKKIDAMREQEARARKRNKNLAVSLTVIGVFIVLLAAVLVVNRLSGPETAVVAAGKAQYVRADSHKLSVAPDGKVTLVEFLDFECEACRAAFPVVEDLRKQYAGKVTFVARHFPLPGHFNAERAARAVEASARQGKFEAMYQRMYETQTQRGEKRVPADDVFRGLAKSLGLDMTAWEKAYNAPETLERINKDVADGKALGMTGTPTFFLNGRRLQPESEADFKAAIDAALAS